MVKTYHNLWPRVISWENLVGAYQKCRRRKRYKSGAVAFDFQWEANLLALQRELADGTYQPGAYRHFRIFEPKPRTISAAPFRDRVVHHAVVRVLEPLFERRFLDDSFACRRGKGTHRALDRAQHYLRRYPYYLKTDIVRFYPNVDHQVLIGVLRRYLHDERLFRLIDRILASAVGVLDHEATPSYFPGDDLFAACRPRGLPIGNLTSQFFANVLLDQIDHFVKEELGAAGYVRYADDMVLFAPSKRTLWEHRADLVERLAEFRLRLHRDKTQVRPSRKGLKFLGFVLLPESRRLQQSGVRRFNRRLRRLRWLKSRRLIRPEDIARSLRAWLAHVQDANSAGLRRALWKRVRF